MPTHTERFFTLNVKSVPPMSQSKVTADVAHGRHLGHVGFWQEIQPARYKAAVAGLSRAVGATTYGIGFECPVTLSARRWHVMKGGVTVHRMHDGMKGVTPSRYVVVVKTRLRRKTGVTGWTWNPDGLKVAHVATHFVSGGWCGPNHKHYRKAARRPMWLVHFEKMQQVVADLHKDGYTVVMGMDANRGVAGMPKFHPAQVKAATHGIDGILVVPAPGVRVKTGRKEIAKAFHSDHDGVAVNVTFDWDEPAAA